MSLINKYNADYGITNNYPDLYKTHLIGIEGSTSFTSYTSTTTTIETNRGDSLLLYLPNITSLDFTGCRIGNDIQKFVFTNCTKLTELIVKDCDVQEFTGVMNLTGAPQLTTLDMRGTTLSINVPENSRLATLKLGTPTSIVINSPTVLNADRVTIQDDSNLTTISIIGVNQTGPCGFTLFNKIYS